MLRFKASLKTKIAYPTGWNWTDAPINIWKTRNGDMITDFDAANFKPIGIKRTYYVAPDGDAENDGLTPQTALSRIRDAITKTDADVDVIEVIVASGHYNETTGWAGQTPTKNLIVKAAPGATVISSNHRNITGLTRYEETDVYYGTRNGTENVADLKYTDDDGNYLGYKKVTSLEDVIATPGSWWRSSGTVPYIHCIDGRQPDSDILITSSQNNGYVTTDGLTIYLENIKFIGGESAFGVINATLAAKGCIFGYARTNGLSTWGAMTYCQDCQAPYNLADGFNYHDYSESFLPKAIEVNCMGTYNGGLVANNADNGSTIHDGGKIIRVNCEYHNNKGPNCIDVNPGTQSWSLSVFAHDSAGSENNYDFSVQLGEVGNNAEMWLEDCVGDGSTTSLYVGTNSTVYTKNCTMPTKTISGTETPY